MNNILRNFGNTPITTTAIASLYPDINGGNQKVSALENSGDILRLKRGLYVVNPRISGIIISIELIANHLYSPSYVSRLTALRHYGLIPEKVVVTQSMTVKHTRKFINSLGFFEYTNVNREYFPIGLRSIETNDYGYIIASPEKALCDLIITTPGINLRYREEAREYLEEDLRFDMDAFAKFDIRVLEQCAKVGKKSSSINTLIQLIRQ